MTSAGSAGGWEPEFVGLPPADAPPAPDEPGGSGGQFDTARWKPEVITTLGGYVTLQTAAELFDVQRERLQVACWRGTLPGRRLPTSSSGGRPGTGRGGQNGMWLVHPGDVARYLATTLRGVSRRRRADEISPQRLERERQRLLTSAANAERVAAEKQAQLAQAPAGEDVNLRLRTAREGVYAQNRRRVADGLAQAQDRQAEAAAQAEAWAREHPDDVETAEA